MAACTGISQVDNELQGKYHGNIIIIINSTFDMWIAN